MYSQGTCGKQAGKPSQKFCVRCCSSETQFRKLRPGENLVLCSHVFANHRKFISLILDENRNQILPLCFQKFNENANAPAMQTRQSRVMHVEDKTKAYRQVVRKDQLEKLEEAKKSPEEYSHQNFNGRRKLVNPTRKNLELKSTFKLSFFTIVAF